MLSSEPCADEGSLLDRWYTLIWTLRGWRISFRPMIYSHLNLARMWCIEMDLEFKFFCSYIKYVDDELEGVLGVWFTSDHLKEKYITRGLWSEICISSRFHTSFQWGDLEIRSVDATLLKGAELCSVPETGSSQWRFWFRMARDVSKLPNLDKLFWMHLYCGLFSWYQRNGVMDQGSQQVFNISGWYFFSQTLSYPNTAKSCWFVWCGVADCTRT